ncbi:DHHA1 domain-containing protein [Desertimonas flava]|uniref:DHHA1 domain-containing protein n=1 Tax=Desertimonas flava TaxID=2064846 RepID=UPI000E347394|nr:DHHA1 domain-containing protein [Desertimonas flava]
MTQPVLAPTTPLVIHHDDCPDGFGAAWWLAKFLNQRRVQPDVEKHAANYGDPLPNVDGRDVWVVDFSYPPEQMRELGERAAGVVVLDHHKKALEQDWSDTGFQLFERPSDLGWGPPGVARRVAVLNMDRSGIGLVLAYIDHLNGHPTPFPTFLLNLEDRDLWRFRMPGTPEVFATVTSYPYADELWDDFEARTVTDLVVEGMPIVRYRQQLIAECVGNAYQTYIDGHFVWIASCPYSVGSDVAQVLAEREPDLFGVYFIVGPSTQVKVGLRSVESGMDVNEIAKRHGGGGHAHAAAFRTTTDAWFAAF